MKRVVKKRRRPSKPIKVVKIYQVTEEHGGRDEDKWAANENRTYW